MKKIIRQIYADKILRWSTIISLLLLFMSGVYLLISYNSLPPFVAIYNQLPWGDDRLGLRYTIFIPFGIALALILINCFLCFYFYEKLPLISRMISATNVLIAVLASLFIIRTLQLMM